MGIGDFSQEQDVKKYPSQQISFVSGDRAQSSDPSAVVNFSISVPQDHDAYERIRLIRAGTRIALLPHGDPDKPDPVEVVSEPNIRLGSLTHRRCREIRLHMLLGATYQGEVVAVTARNGSCDLLMQVTRYVSEEGHGPE